MATIDRTSTTAAAFPMKSSASATASNRWSRLSAVLTPPSVTVDFLPNFVNSKNNNMRNEIIQLKDLGRMPNESINDTEDIIEVIRSYDELLEQIQFPISLDEAQALVQIFPESSFYDLQWSLLKLVESVIRIVDGDTYLHLINSCPSQEWRDVLNTRYKNYKKEQEVSK